MSKLLNIKYCSGCRDNYYNSPSTSGTGDCCWGRKDGKIVWRIPVGMWEAPPYLNKKKIRVASCWHGSGNNRTIMVKSEALRSDGYWKH